MSGISPRQRLAQALGKVRNRLELPVKAGVSSRYVGNAVLGIPVPTIPYLRLCMAIGLDPAPGRILIIPPPSNFDFDFFALGFTLARRVKRDNLEMAATVLEVRPSTIAALERGYALPIGVVLRACNYINIHPFGYCTTPNVSRETRAA